MIKLFAYTSKDGRKSIKIVAVTGEDSVRFGGISLGKVLLNSSLDLNEVLSTYKNYTVLDHMPRRGEGLPQYNECWKMFNKSNIYCELGELDPNKVNTSDLIKTINLLKNLPAAKEEEIVTKIQSSKSEKDKVSILPSALVAIIAVAGVGNVSSAAKIRCKTENISFNIIDNEGFNTNIDSDDINTSSSSDYVDENVITHLRALANALGYDIIKK